MDEVRIARDRVLRLERASRLRAALSGQLAEVAQELAALQERYAVEQDDVDRLQRRTFTAIIAGVLGTREVRLTKEQAEAHIARLRVEGHRARHRQLGRDLVAVTKELMDLADAPHRYAEALADAEQVLPAGDPRAAELSELAARQAQVCADLRGHDEAMRAGRAALTAVDRVLDALGGALIWSTVDVSSGRLADRMEYDRLDRAQAAAWDAQQTLDVFTRELADLGVHLRVEIPGVDTRWFADVVFDGLLTDLFKHEQIARTRDNVVDLAHWLQATLDQLEHGRAELAGSQAALQARREQLHGRA